MADIWIGVKAKFRTARQRYVVGVLLLTLALVTFAYSTIFYVLMRALEGRPVSAWESFFWTVNRLSTTGELPPELHYRAALIQALSVLTQVTGLAFVFAFFPLVIIPAIERQLLGVSASIGAMRDHVVIFGFSTVVESLVNELATGPHPFVIVDDNLESIRKLR